jgi:hypothetical protein
MTDISQYIDNDRTLRAMSEEIIKASVKKPRNYLGMSEIGEPCWRMLWYRFRNVLEETLTLKSLLAIEDGYKQEDIMASRLRLVPGVKLETINPETGEQFGVKLIGGHFAGHLDGKIIGIYESPKTLHIWENKAVNEKKFESLKKLILSEGEKQALALWDETYYAQAVIYMKAFKFTRHYMTVESPGGRDYTSCRTEANNKDAVSLIAKAETIIKADRPPQRLSENRSFYKCGWCRMKEVCFDSKVPAVNCRTCAFGEPITDDPTNTGAWKCYKKNINFTGAGECDCDKHLFLNTLLPFKTIDADQSSATPNWLKYGLDSGEVFYNVNADAKTIKGSRSLTSKELFDLEYFELAFSEDKVKNETLKAAQEHKTEIKKLKGVI